MCVSCSPLQVGIQIHSALVLTTFGERGELQYVILRVFRVLLSKGLCSDETEEVKGDEEGDIDGIKDWALDWRGQLLRRVFLSPGFRCRHRIGRGAWGHGVPVLAHRVYHAALDRWLLWLVAVLCRSVVSLMTPHRSDMVTLLPAVHGMEEMSLVTFDPSHPFTYNTS